MQSLKGKTALVTGGSRGIGREIAERLARDGATVALTYNASKAGAEDAVKAIEDAGGAAFALQADLADADAIRPCSSSSIGSSRNGTAGRRSTYSLTMPAIPAGADCRTPRRRAGMQWSLFTPGHPFSSCRLV